LVPPQDLERIFRRLMQLGRLLMELMTTHTLTVQMKLQWDQAQVRVVASLVPSPKRLPAASWGNMRREERAGPCQAQSAELPLWLARLEQAQRWLELHRHTRRIYGRA